MRDENQTSDSARVVLAVAQHKGCTSKEVKLIEHMVRTLVVQDSHFLDKIDTASEVQPNSKHTHTWYNGH